MQGGGQTTDKKRTVHCQEIWGVEQMGRVLGESRTSALGVLDIEGNRPLPERENKKGHFRSSVCVCVCLYKNNLCKALKALQINQKDLFREV